MDKKWIQILMIVMLVVLAITAAVFYHTSNRRQNELEALNAKIDTIREEVVAFKNDIDQLQKKIHQAEQENRVLSDENLRIPRLESLLAELNRERDTGLEQVRQLAQDLKSVTAQRDEIRTRLDDLSAEHGKTLEQIRQLRPEIERRDAALRQLEDELKTQGQAGEAIEAQFKQEIGNLKSEISARTAERDDARAQARRLAEDLKSVTAQRDEVRTRLDDLSAEHGKTLEQIQQLRPEIQRRDAALRQLKDELKAQGQAGEAIEARLQEKIAGLEARLAAPTRDLDAVYAQVRQLETDLRKATTIRDENLARLDEMTARHAVAVDRIAQLQSALETRNTDIEKLEAAQQVAFNKVQFLKDSLTDRGVELNRLNQQLSLLDQEKEKAVKSAAKLQKTHDELLTEFRTAISSREATIKALHEKLKVTLIDEILFDFGKASISNRGKSLLIKIGNILKKMEGHRIVIAGHTDNVPIRGAYMERFPTNWELSSARATAVVRFFQDEVGLDPSRMEAVGHSYYKPVVDHDTISNRAKNRRVEIFIMPE